MKNIDINTLQALQKSQFVKIVKANREISLISALILIILLAVGGFLIVKPGSAKEAALRQSIAQYQDRAKILRTIRDSQDAIASYQAMLPKDADSNWLISRISSIADEQGIRPESITPQEPVETENVRHLRASLVFSASYVTLGKFAAAIEGASDFMKIDSITFAAARYGMDVSEEAMLTQPAPKAAEKIRVECLISTLVLKK